MRPLASVMSEKEMVSVLGEGSAVQHVRPVWSGVLAGTAGVRESGIAGSLDGAVVQPATSTSTVEADPRNRFMEGAQ